jgi:hypothetical protein
LPKRRRSGSGPILTAVLAVLVAGAVAAFVFFETKDDRVAHPTPGSGNPSPVTPSHG